MKISFNSMDSSISFDKFVCENKAFLFAEIEEIFNLGLYYDEYPVFILTDQYVFRVFINDLIVKFDIFPKMFFFDNLENNHVFRESEKEFNYIYFPESYKSKCSILNISLVGDDDSSSDYRMVFSLSNNTNLYLCPSELVKGAMDSWIE